MIELINRCFTSILFLYTIIQTQLYFLYLVEKKCTLFLKTTHASIGKCPTRRFLTRLMDYIVHNIYSRHNSLSSPAPPPNNNNIDKRFYVAYYLGTMSKVEIPKDDLLQSLCYGPLSYYIFWNKHSINPNSLALVGQPKQFMSVERSVWNLSDSEPDTTLQAWISANPQRGLGKGQPPLETGLESVPNSLKITYILEAITRLTCLRLPYLRL